MSTLEAIVAILAAILGGFLASWVSARQERWKFRQERAALKEDRQEAKEDRTDVLSEELEHLKEDKDEKDIEYGRRLASLEQVNGLQTHALCLILLDRILTLGAEYMARGEISFDEKRMLKAMYDCYHNELGGNGDAELMMQTIEDLPIKPRTHHE